MAIKLGRQIKLLWGGAAVEDMKSLTVSGSRGTIDLTTYDSATFAAFGVGTQTWTVSGSFLVDYAATEGYDEMLADFIAGTNQTALISSTTSTDTTISGTAFITSFENSNDLDGPSMCNFSMQMTGTVAQGTVA